MAKSALHEVWTGADTKAALVMSYAEAAKLLNRTKVTVRSYVRKGVLSEFRLPGCERALGVDVRSIRKMLEGEVAR